MILSHSPGRTQLVEIKQSVVSVVGLHLSSNFPEEADCDEHNVDDDKSKGPFHYIMVQANEGEKKYSVECKLHEEQPEAVCE